jgi:hypothetical protein
MKYLGGEWHKPFMDTATCTSMITSIREPNFDLCLGKFSDIICVKRNKRKWCDGQRSSRTAVADAGWSDRDNEPPPLIQLQSEDGSCTWDPTYRQIENGCMTGNALASNWFLCRKYCALYPHMCITLRASCLLLSSPRTLVKRTSLERALKPVSDTGRAFSDTGRAYKPGVICFQVVVVSM